LVPSSDQKDDALDQLVTERLAALSVKSFDELAALPSMSQEDVVRDGKKYILSVWHDALGSGEHQIVVQAYKPPSWFSLGFGRMRAEGFCINNRNERRALSEEDLWPFT